MTHASAFSADYATARARFVRAAADRGAALSALPVAATGPNDEMLSVDIAAIGPVHPDTVVIVSSGLHGVEGIFGSAVQLAWLSNNAHIPPDVRVVLVHALNPYGFAWRRRTNEHNVDLNRNFLDFLPGRYAIPTAAHVESQRVYDRLSTFLNPASSPSRFDPYALRAAYRALRVGLAQLQRSLPIGQYAHPRGLFYGGHEAEASTTLVRDGIADWIGDARLTVHIDLHSGLGAWGQQQWLIDDMGGSERAGWAAAHFGRNVRASDDHVTYRAQGTMTGDLRARIVSCQYLGITAEFGTYSGIRMLGALRAENRAHIYATQGSSTYERAKQQLVEVFAPASIAWREGAVSGALDLIDRATAARLV